MSPSPAPLFESIAYQLRQRGIVLTALPGEYCVNFLNGKADTAETRENFSEAVELAWAMADKSPATSARQASAYRGKRRLSMRPKAIIKRRIKAHNRRLRARLLKAQSDAAHERPS
jgi:hypothetical protein